MPVILFAQVLCAVGAGLLKTLRTTTSTAVWAPFMVLTGLSKGLGVNVPHIAIQAVMKNVCIPGCRLMMKLNRQCLG